MYQDKLTGERVRVTGHVLHPTGLDAAFDADPDVLTIGQGADRRMRVVDETARAPVQNEDALPAAVK